MINSYWIYENYRLNIKLNVRTKKISYEGFFIKIRVVNQVSFFNTLIFLQ